MKKQNIPLVVDLDGTLVRTDMLVESAWYFLINNPWRLLNLFIWLRESKSMLKSKLAEQFHFTPRNLPFRPEVLAIMREAKSDGREIVLATASNRVVAERVSLELGVFDHVLSSNQHLNLSGATKAAALEEKFGKKGFDYIGDSPKDLPVWKKARTPYLVGTGRIALKTFNKLNRGVILSGEANLSKIRIWTRSLRLHQWVKNLLLFVPAIAAHQLLDLGVFSNLVLAFISFGFLASAVYLLNDLVDLENDRSHDKKKLRPLANGDMSILSALFGFVILLGGAFVLGLSVGNDFAGVLLGYLLLTSAYTVFLKKILVLDVVTLATLYMLRVIAGGVAVSIPVSFWLLAFSFFIFLSLSFLKRVSELEGWVSGKLSVSPGRAYKERDLPTISTLGIGSGLVSVLVFALYLDSDSLSGLYQNPMILWGAVPVLVFWISWVWIQSGRGEVDQDPIIFAFKDRFSLASGVIFLSLFMISQVSTFSWV
jgi:4-hydroxybenzoate polyprenyltransferase/phosphoserine phosphatase